MGNQAWRSQLIATVAREQIPAFLEDLQSLVQALRRWRDDLVVPTPEQVAPHLPASLRAHPELVLAYLDDPRYRQVVESALAGSTGTPRTL